MRGFETNNCRLCEKAFCCEKCRVRHETNFHKVLPDCDICIYGQFVFENIGDTYLQHIETSHLPLNCVYCKRIFHSIEDILQHKKCPILQLKDDSPKTPFKQATPGILISADDQDSPILLELQRKEALNYIFNLATSTPMQRGQEPKLIFEKSKDPITPVDRNSQVINKSIIKKTDSLKSDHSSKRRVTFGETPGSSAANKSIVSEDKKIFSNKDMEFSGQKFSDAFLTPVTGMSTEPFYSAKSEVEPIRNTQFEVSSKVARNNSTAPQGFTPVSASNAWKIITYKGYIYNTQELQVNSLSGEKSSSIKPSQDKNATQDSNLNKGPMEICTPGRSSVALKSESNDSAAKTDEESSDTFSERNSTKESKMSIHFCTPVATPNIAKIITSKENIYKPQESEVKSLLDGNSSSSMEPSQDKNETHDSDLNEGSMEICTPEKSSVAFKSESYDSAAKTDEESSNIFSEKISTKESKSSINFCTPVATPNIAKIITSKENIFKPQESEVNSLLDGNSSSSMEPSQDKNETHDSDLNEVSMEICTPERSSVAFKSEFCDSAAKTDEESPNIFSEASSTKESKPSINFCTPANPGKITVKGVMYKNPNLSLNDQHASPADNEKSEVSIDKENQSENDSTNREPEVADATGCKTLWLSAINLEDSNGAGQQNKENETPNDENKMPDDKKYSKQKIENLEPPPKPTTRRVSIVSPTPVLKRTDVKMKFHIPAHFSSTPIISSGVVKMKQTRIVKEISARVIKSQTPFKTPQGKLSEFRQQSIRACKFETFSDIGAGPSSTQNELVLLPQINENSFSSETNPSREITTYHSNIQNHGISVSSMTESTLWTSMTRIVKSVLGFSNTSDTNMSVNNSATSFKRQLSDSDSSGHFLEAPRLKRFKFTDIKCRRPIRNLPALEAPRKLPAITGPVTTSLEIVKSTSTLYGDPRMRIQCDKATQTDDYLMYGWHPKI